jgi:sugar (glycoside-pentoside-hexuronide) transporter
LLKIKEVISILDSGVLDMKLTFKEKAAHAIGGVGHNLIYALFSGYLLIFYTDVFGLSSAFTGTLFLIARIWDAFNNPFFGAVMDRTHTRWGRYRPWLFFSAPIVALLIVLCFLHPSFNQTLQYVYCYVTYILLGMAFTATDIPYWTLPSVMTDAPAERNQIFSISTIASSLAAGIGAVVVPLIYGALGKEQGLLVAAIVFACIAIVCYFIAGINVRERIKPAPFHKGILASLKSVVTNKPLLIIMAVSLLANFAFQLKVAVNAYYGEYTLGKVSYVTWLSAMLLFGMLVGSAFVPLLIKKLGSKNTTLITLGLGVVVSLGYWACGYNNVVIVLIWSALCAAVIGSFSVLLNVLTADAMDYAELKKVPGMKRSSLRLAPSSRN